MPPRYRRSLLLLLCLAPLVLSACTGARVTQVETNLRGLKEEIVELRRSQTAQRVQFDDFRNRLVVLQDKLDSERLARSRRGKIADVPQLPRVVVARRAPLAPLVRPPSERASRTIVMGPDNVPHVTDASKTRRKRAGKSSRQRRTVAAGPTAGGGAPAPGGVTREERAAGAYRAAKSLLDGGRLREARDRFTDFIRKHPKHQLADNAMYWIGETWYAQAMWIKAAGVFHKVVRRYSTGNKVPDAMLKMALCYRKLGKRGDAQAVLRELIQRFPTTSAADLARRKLAQSGRSSPSRRP